MNKVISDMIQKYERPGDFTHAEVTDEMILTAEETLGVKIPEQYVQFLHLYGQGGVAGIEVLGIGLSGRMIFVEATLDYREEGLPLEYLVIENVDEWVMCIDCKDGKVVSWDMSRFVKEEYGCFDDYLIDQMHSAIENL